MNKFIFLKFMVLAWAIAAVAQKQETTYVDEIPEFPGGNDKVASFIMNALQYPEIANINGIEGRAIAKFVVDTDGSVINIELTKPIHPLLDSEVVRIFKAMPKWKPGMQNGKAVKVYFTQAVNFRTAYHDDKDGLNEKGGYFGGRRAEQFDTFPAYNGSLEQELKVTNELLPKGTVNVLVSINSAGIITQAKVIGQSKETLEQPALDVVKNLKHRWMPATKVEQAVACQMILPVKFNKKQGLSYAR